MNLEMRMVPEELTPKYFFDLSGFAHTDLFDDVNHVWDALKNINSYLLDYIEKNKFRYKHRGDIGNEVYVGENVTMEPFTHIIGPVIIGDNSIIQSFVRMEGPVVIGTDSEIRSGSYIRGNVIVGNECVVRSEMKNSIMMNNSHGAHLSYIGDSILGNHCNLGAGSVLSNLKHDESVTRLKFYGEVVETGLKKFGAILGDGVKISCNKVADPGTLVGRDTYLLCDFGGFVPSEKYVIMKEGRIEMRDNKYKKQ